MLRNLAVKETNGEVCMNRRKDKLNYVLKVQKDLPCWFTLWYYFSDYQGKEAKQKPIFMGIPTNSFFLQQKSMELVVVHRFYLSICMGTL